MIDFFLHLNISRKLREMEFHIKGPFRKRTLSSTIKKKQKKVGILDHSRNNIKNFKV